LSGQTPLHLEASGEEGVEMIKALVGLGDIVTNVNTENDGQISNLPAHIVVETNHHFSRNQARPIQAGALPAGLAALINLHCTNQELIIEAALNDDDDLAFQSFQNDPTNHLPIDVAWEFFNRLLQIRRTYLPSMALAEDGVLS
jgi:alpha-galactosidase/6-phospho-beta-glucosidase family protein